MDRYLNVRFDSAYSREVATAKLLDLVQTFPELKQIDKLQFENKEGFPYGIVSLIQCDAQGCFSFNRGDYFENVNLVEFLIPDTEEAVSHYLKLAKRITEMLQWELVDADTDEVLIEGK